MVKMKHKKKYHLKNNYKNILFILFSSILIICMQNSKFLKPIFKFYNEKYLKKEFINESKTLNKSISQAVFNDDIKFSETTNKEIIYDDMFFVKEIKDDKPIIYLYNTHQGENYLKKEGTEYTPNIMTTTSYLNEKLNDKSLPTIMETKSVSKVLSDNNWKYGYSYRVSRSFINDAVNEYPSIKYLFDIHRDSGKREHTTLCVNNKCYAKLLFLVGLENPNYEENQKYAEELSKRVNNKLDGLSKGILQKKGKNVNGVYNQDFSNRTILIEVGGENNYLEEVYNSLDILSEVIFEFIREELNNGL